VKTHREGRYSTIDEPGRIPYFKRYDMERDNEGLINRLTDILSAQHTEIEKQGYTRYNRSFMPKSHLSI
jgi:glycine cleavage system regulatory protein